MKSTSAIPICKYFLIFSMDAYFYEIHTSPQVYGATRMPLLYKKKYVYTGSTCWTNWSWGWNNNYIITNVTQGPPT